MSSQPKLPGFSRKLAPRSFTPLRMPALRVAPKAETVVLVVDGDRVSRRFADIALGRGDAGGGGSIVVETAEDAAGALAILRSTLVDLIVADSDFSDMSGLAFHQHLAQDSRFGAIPFIFLAADARVQTKILALASGADDYLLKPCDPIELRVRVQSIVGRHRRMRDAFLSRGYALAGEFSAIPFPDLVSILGVGQCTGTLAVATSRTAGRIFFDGGRVVHAIFGNLSGAEAFYEILGETSGKFELSLQIDPEAAGTVTIQESLTSLIMEGARVLDSRGRARVTRLSEGAMPPPPPSSVGVRPAPPSSAQTAAQLCQAIGDVCARGEMSLFTQSELARWTLASGGLERMHVLLLADVKSGVSAILPLAADPTERWVLDALSAEPKVASLTYYMRRDRVLDVLLLDVLSAGTFRSALRRVPSLVVLAPPSGDFLEIGATALGELEALFATLPPTVLLGVGNAALERHLRDWCAARCASTRVECLRGVLGEGRTDLRGLLGAGIQIWGELDETSRSRA